MIATYPEEVSAWHGEEAERGVELLKELVHGARSLRTEYRVANNVKAAFYFRAEDSAVRQSILNHVRC